MRAITDLGYVDLDAQIPSNAEIVLMVYEEPNGDTHLVATSKFDIKTWGGYLARFAQMLSAHYKDQQPEALAAICDAFNNKVRQHLQ